MTLKPDHVKLMLNVIQKHVKFYLTFYALQIRVELNIKKNIKKKTYILINEVTNKVTITYF